MYRIVDVQDFAEGVRKEVSKAFGLDDHDERYVTTGQIVSFVKEKCRREEDEYLVDEKGISEIIEFANSLAIGTCMNEMAVDGELECAWDAEKNDMIWWLADKEK